MGSWDGNIYALNATSGVKIWKYTTEGAVNSAIVFCNDTLYFGSNDQYIYALKIIREPAAGFTSSFILVIMAISSFSLACILLILGFFESYCSRVRSRDPSVKKLLTHVNWSEVVRRAIAKSC